MLAPGSQTWTVVQPYSLRASFTWNTIGAPQGPYRFIVKARDASSPGTYSNYASSWDSYVAITDMLSSTPCTSVTAASSPSGTASSGTTVPITGAASGCPTPDYQFALLVPRSHTRQLFQPYS